LNAVDTQETVCKPSPQYNGIAFDPDARYSDLSSRFDILEEQLQIGSHSLVIDRIRNTNALLESIDPTTFSVDERLPYWAELWPSSIELARYCLERTGMCGRKVLELGCGLGLAGIAAAMAGAHVVFSDYEPVALDFARSNVLKNLPSDVIGSRVKFRLLDWRSADVIGPVDMIIGADVTYEQRNFLPILSFVRRALAHNGCAVFTDPDRTTGMSFFALAEQQGFHVTLSSRALGRAQRTSTILLAELRSEREEANEGTGKQT
jgi:predicted nicotinamide N-methyase